MKEQKQYLSLLEQLKDYDEELAQGLAARAFQEQERQRLEVFSFYNIHAAFRLEKTRIKGSLFPFQGRSMVVWLFQYSIFAKLHLLQQNCICCRQECETRSGAEKRFYHNLQSGHLVWWSSDTCNIFPK